MNFNRIFLIALLFSVVFFVGCDDNDPEPENPEELITTVELSFTEIGGTDMVEMVFRDLDGDGGDPPEITGGTLKANTEYDLVVSMFNETETPPEPIHEEVEEEDEEHQLFFSFTPDIGIMHTYEDEDPNGNPLGLENTMETDNAGTTALTVVLRHEPDKFGTGVSDGDITNAGGETDIEVTFPVTVQ